MIFTVLGWMALGVCQMVEWIDILNLYLGASLHYLHFDFHLYSDKFSFPPLWREARGRKEKLELSSQLLKAKTTLFCTWFLAFQLKSWLETRFSKLNIGLSETVSFHLWFGCCNRADIQFCNDNNLEKVLVLVSTSSAFSGYV